MITPGSLMEAAIEVQIFADVFDALADTPAEAADLKARSDLLSSLADRVKAVGVASSGGGEAAGDHACPAG